MVELWHSDSSGAAFPATNANLIQRKSFPIEPGFTNKSDLAAMRVTKTVLGKQYAYGYLCPLRFVASGYVGWRGSIRWKVTLSRPCCDFIRGPISVTRYSGCTPANIREIVPDKNTNVGLQTWYIGFDESTTLNEGGQLIVPQVEPIASFEVPFYTSRRFLHSRSLMAFTADSDTSYEPCWKYSYESSPEAEDSTHQLYCAAGEDFTLGMFIGAPIVYLEGSPPV
jgi:hypothetical protein